MHLHTALESDIIRLRSRPELLLDSAVMQMTMSLLVLMLCCSYLFMFTLGPLRTSQSTGFKSPRIERYCTRFRASLMQMQVCRCVPNKAFPCHDAKLHANSGTMASATPMAVPKSVRKRLYGGVFQHAMLVLSISEPAWLYGIFKRG